MAKSKRRIAAAARKRARKEAWKSMTPEARKEWSDKRLKTAKTGYAKRARERKNGEPMSDRAKETPAWTLRAFGATLNRMATHIGMFPDRLLA